LLGFIFEREEMKYKVIENYADNGALCGHSILDTETGETMGIIDDFDELKALTEIKDSAFELCAHWCMTEGHIVADSHVKKLNELVDNYHSIFNT
jgi:hypothetical protein